jgi:transposase, IS5 family
MHALGTIPQMQALIGNIVDLCITDAGYRSHNAPSDHKFKVYTCGQKRRLTPQIKREFARRAGVPPLSLSQATSPDGPQLPRPRQRRRHQRVLAAVGYNLSEGSLDVQAIF